MVVAEAIVAAALRRFRSQAQGTGVRGELLAVTPEEAAQLQFPIGHPRKKVVYIGHPVDPPLYVPVAVFHRYLFEHKVAEALRLIRSLGARTVEVGVGAGVPLPPSQPVELGVSVSRNRATGHSVMSRLTLSPSGKPHIPADLVWFPHEPLWKEVAQARLESGLTSFALDVRSTDDYGVNANLKALVAKSGLERRVARGISAPGSHGTERDSLPSFRSSHPSFRNRASTPSERRALALFVGVHATIAGLS